MAQGGTVRNLVAKPLGRILLTLLATGTLIGSYLYLGPLFSIPTFLFFGLAIPIYLGWKRPRQLAIVGLAALLIAAPLASLWEASMLRMPSQAASSSNALPYGNGGSVLQNATVNPYTGAAGGVYNFSVTVHPEFVPKNTSGPLWVELFVTTCPGATGNNSPTCFSGYPFYALNHTLPANLTSPLPVWFNAKLPGANLWWFQFATAYKVNKTAPPTWIFLAPSTGYSAVQGPVSGDYFSTVAIVIPSLYLGMLTYPGLVFFLALVVYYFFKRREAARKAALPGAPPSTSSPAGPVAGAGAEGGTRAGPDERRCPNCQAVVYPNEKTCWKCGAPLGAPKADAPLATGPGPRGPS